MKDKIYRAVPLKIWEQRNPGQDFNLFPYDILDEGIHVLEAVSLPSEEESNTELNKLAEQIGLNRAKPSDVALGWRKCYDWLRNVINVK